MLVEGHLDSRCEGLCDTACFAPGAEDNASGSALVMELARVMSNYTFKRSIIFLLTVGEEQGLYGAEAFSQYCVDNSISLVSVQNNDVCGGVICGPNSSPPSCPFDGHIDSTSIRIFSQGTLNSIHKDYARFIKTVYQEKLLPEVAVEMEIRIMSPEDRTGRGGDHIPFRQDGYRAVRFTAANEHGNANPVPTYTGRQHSVRDVIGKDTDGNGSIDSFYVDFNYLARNAVINGAAMTVAASGPTTPDFTLTDDGTTVTINISDPEAYEHYRIGVRTLENDFDAQYTHLGSGPFEVPGIEPGKFYHISVASVDDGAMSLYSPEENFIASANTLSSTADTVLFFPTDCNATGISTYIIPGRILGISLSPVPNPFGENALIRLISEEKNIISDASLKMFSPDGRLIWEKSIEIRPGLNEENLELNSELSAGVYLLTLQSNGRMIQSRRLVLTQ